MERHRTHDRDIVSVEDQRRFEDILAECIGPTPVRTSSVRRASMPTQLRPAPFALSAQQQQQSPRPYRPLALNGIASTAAAAASSSAAASTPSSPCVSPPPPATGDAWADDLLSRPDAAVSREQKPASLPLSQVSSPGSSYDGSAVVVVVQTPRTTPPPTPPVLPPPPVQQPQPQPQLPESILNGLPAAGGSLTVIDELPTFTPRQSPTLHASAPATAVAAAVSSARRSSMPTGMSPFEWQRIAVASPPTAYVMARPMERGPASAPLGSAAAPAESQALPIPSRRATVNPEAFLHHQRERQSAPAPAGASPLPTVVPALRLPPPVSVVAAAAEDASPSTSPGRTGDFSLFSAGHNLFPTPKHSPVSSPSPMLTPHYQQQQQQPERRHRFMSSPSAVTRKSIPISPETQPPAAPTAAAQQTSVSPSTSPSVKVHLQQRFVPGSPPVVQHHSITPSPRMIPSHANPQQVVLPPSPSQPTDGEDEDPDPDALALGGGADGGKQAPASRQRIKLLLKRLKLEASAAGHNWLQQLVGSFMQNESSGGPDRWMILLELADMAKREDDLDTARHLYRAVVKLKPRKSQVWLEYSKMEEETGQLDHARSVLRHGLQHCPLCEVLMIKMIKTEERLGNIAGAHALLGRLKDQPLEKTWRTVLEGAQLEARLGNIEVARSVFRFLMRNVSWCGPIFQEACRFEERCEDFERALHVAEEGLRENPKYGPLWFSALRLYERIAPEKLRAALQTASETLLRDLRWKVFFEWAQVESRAGNLSDARKAYAHAAEHSPGNLEWKVWWGASRTELVAGNVDNARQLVARALGKVPPKMRPTVILEQARLEEYSGCVDAARAVLEDAKKTAKHEWKVFLERVLLEIRACDHNAALFQAKEALLAHAGTGRLWAVYIQLKRPLGLAEQERGFQRALHEVPKSGEVWCEGARVYIGQGRYQEARECLAHAAQFTPQYGDTFIECLRNELAETGRFTEPCALEQACVNAEPNYGPLWLACKRHPLESPRQVLRNARAMLHEALVACKDSSPFTARFLDVNEMYHAARILSDPERLKLVFGSDSIRA